MKIGVVCRRMSRVIPQYSSQRTETAVVGLIERAQGLTAHMTLTTSNDNFRSITGFQTLRGVVKLCRRLEVPRLRGQQGFGNSGSPARYSMRMQHASGAERPEEDQ